MKLCGESRFPEHDPLAVSSCSEPVLVPYEWRRANDVGVVCNLTARNLTALRASTSGGAAWSGAMLARGFQSDVTAVDKQCDSWTKLLGRKHPRSYSQIKPRLNLSFFHSFPPRPSHCSLLSTTAAISLEPGPPTRAMTPPVPDAGPNGSLDADISSTDPSTPHADSRHNNRTNSKLLDLGFVPAPQIPDPWSVDAAVATIPGGAPEEGSSSPLPFFHILERLKTTKREGWRRFGIER